MTSVYHPYRWLRRVAEALKRWAGSVQAGCKAWVSHREKLADDVVLLVKQPPLQTPVLPAHPRLSNPQCEQLQAAMVLHAQSRLRAENLEAIVAAVRRGASVCALLEEQKPNRCPALVIAISSDR